MVRHTHVPGLGAAFAAALVLVLGASDAGAQAQPPVQALTLRDAVRLTMERSPVLARAREDVARQLGAQREAAGLFDSIFRIAPAVEHTDVVLSADWYGRELSKRRILEGMKDQFAIIRDNLKKTLDEHRGDLPLCPEGASFYEVIVPGETDSRPLCRPVDRTVQGAGSTVEGVSASTFFVRPIGTFQPLAMLDFQRGLASAFDIQMDRKAEDLRQHNIELLLQNYYMADEIARRAALDRIRVGDMPRYETVTTASLRASWAKLFRSGSFVEVRGVLNGAENAFRDKPLDPIFGGKADPNRFRSRFELALTQPLGRGRGAVTVAATERASVHTLEATRFTYQQAVFDNTLRTTLAYFDLAAAQQSVALFEQSLNVERRLLEATTRQVGAGDLARTDLTRLQARVAELESSLAGARTDAVYARVALAESVGLGTQEAAPELRAADVLPAAPLPIDLDAAIRDATARRDDVRAATAFRETSRVFFEAARAETRPRADLSLSAGLGNSYYGPYHRVLKDELKYKEFEPKESFADYYSLRGFGRAFQKKWEPIATINFTWELPFGNNAAVGRMVQARAALAQSEIHLGDVVRLVNTNIAGHVTSIRRARDEWARRKEAVTQHEAAWGTTETARRSGEVSMIDTLLTEQELTQARIALVDAQRAYMAAVSRFRYETGTLVTFSDWSRGEVQLGGILGDR